MSKKFQDITEHLLNVNKLFCKINKKFNAYPLPKKASETLHDIKDSLITLNKLSTEVDWGRDLSNQQNNEPVKIEHQDEEQTPIKKDISAILKKKYQDNPVMKQEAMNSSQKSSQKPARGPYRQYSSQVKETAIQLHRQGVGFSKISKMLCIPSKNVIRWCRNGASRKPGAGRKVLDPQMEQNLNKWIESQFPVSSTISNALIRIKAKEMTQHKQFFASLGWLKNFIKRYHLKEKYRFI